MDKIEIQELSDKKDSETEADLLKYGFDNINVIPGSRVPNNYQAYLQIINYIQSTSKIYYPDRFVLYFTNFVKELASCLNFFEVRNWDTAREPDFGHDIWNSLFNVSAITKIINKICYESDFDDLSYFEEKILQGIRYKSNVNSPSPWPIDNTTYNYFPTFEKKPLVGSKYRDEFTNFTFYLPYEIIEYHFSSLIKKCPEIDLKPFFKYELDEFKKNISSCDFNDNINEVLYDTAFLYGGKSYKIGKRGVINYKFYNTQNQVIFLIYCIKKYPEYFSEEDKKIIRDYFFRFRIVYGKWSFRLIKAPHSNVSSQFKGNVLITSSFSLIKERYPGWLKFNNVCDYMDLWKGSKPLDVFKKALIYTRNYNSKTYELFDATEYSREIIAYNLEYFKARYNEIIFSNLAKNFYFGYLSFIFCLQYDREHISNYVNFVVRIDCPIVAYNFIKKLYNELTEDDINNIKILLAKDSPLLLKKANNIIKNNSTSNLLTSNKLNDLSIAKCKTKVRKI